MVKSKLKRLTPGTGSALEKLPVKEVMKMFFHTDKVQEVGKILMYLREPDNKDKVGLIIQITRRPARDFPGNTPLEFLGILCKIWEIA